LWPVSLCRLSAFGAVGLWPTNAVFSPELIKGHQ
jgi:hypothetical protein